VPVVPDEGEEEEDREHGQAEGEVAATRRWGFARADRRRS
jgi:hypothetical protein